MIAEGVIARRKDSLIPNRVGFSWQETAATLSAWIQFRRSVSQKSEPIEDRFSRLAQQWKSHIGGISDPQEIRQLPGFAELVRLGPDAIPLILRELEFDSSYWFEVLAEIAGEDPTPAEQAGDVDAMIRAWKDWAAGKNLR
jgi:hypothetical protein